MSYPINATVQVKGGPTLTDYSNLTVSQFMFSHHTFSLDVSFEALGQALGLPTASVHVQAPQQLVGQELTISWQPRLPQPAGGVFRFRGLITEASLRSTTDLANYYHLSGYSPTVLLEDGLQNRIFRQKSLAAIFQQVLAPYPADALPHELAPRHTEVLPYVVQYQETNFQFLSRLAARQGEWLLYDGLTLRLGPPPRAAATRFQTSGVQSFALNLRLQPVRATGGAYNYRTHEPLRATAAAAPAGHAYSQLAARKSQEVFTQPQRRPATTRLADQGQLQRALDTLAAQQAGTLVALEGTGELPALAPGYLLDVYDAAGAGYGEFRVLLVRHLVDGDGNYYNHFEALPGALDTPPAQPGPPPTAHPELAEVIDVQDPRRLGRVRVRFQWEVPQALDAESSWLRVSTPYSGDGKGQLFTPEVGSQVLVGYEQALPEFPVVLGNLFHPKNKQDAKYTTPQNHLKGLQTAGGNKFVMSDSKDAQTILISNSNKKGTAITLGFQHDGSISLVTDGPVIINGQSVAITARENVTITAGQDFIVTAQKQVLLGAQQEGMVFKSKKGLDLVAETENIALQAQAQKITFLAQADVEITAVATARVTGAEVEFNKA